MTNFNDVAEDALKQVLSNPEAHARLIRMSQALLAVSSIEDPNPLRAVGHLMGSSIEYMKGVGLTREFILDFVGSMFDILNGEGGAALRDAALKQKG